MNIIKIILTIGLWFFVVEKGYNYLKLREEIEKIDETSDREELKKARWAFIKILALAVIYTYYNLA